MKNFHYCPRPFIVCLVFIRLASILSDCMVSVRERPILYQSRSHGVTQQGKRSERIHSFLAKINRFLYVHINFLALRTFEQAANFEVTLCPNYLIILLIIISTSSSLHHHYLIKVRINFFLIGTRSVTMVHGMIMILTTLTCT